MRRPATFEPDEWLVFVTMEDGSVEEIIVHVHAYNGHGLPVGSSQLPSPFRVRGSELYRTAVEEAQERGLIPAYDVEEEEPPILLNRGGWTNEGPYGP